MSMYYLLLFLYLIITLTLSRSLSFSLSLSLLAVKTLMVIGLVWTDDSVTKILCSKALLNILAGEEIRSTLIQDGVISAFVSFINSENSELLNICSTGLRYISFIS